MYKEITENGRITEFKGDIEIIGTSLVGEFITKYETLVRIFGEPTYVYAGNGEKIDAEWLIKTPAGPATIYNYKDGKSYLGDQGLDVEDITDWHIGGSNINAYAWVAFAIHANA